MRACKRYVWAWAWGWVLVWGWAAAGAAEGRLRVVATTPDLGAIATLVGGERVELTTLTKATEDPHFVDAKPSFVVKLNRADALIEGGAELEAGWLEPLLRGARNPRIAPGAPGRIVAAEGLSLLEVPTVLDRAQGDIHAAGNPHYLVDPVNAGLVAGRVAEAFARLDGAGEAEYRERAVAFRRQLEERLVGWQARLAPYRGRQVVAYHNLWPYFARRFGVRFDLFLEPKPGIPPTPGHLARVIERMKAEGVRVIVVEPFQSVQTAEKIAGATGAKVVRVTQYPGGVPGTERGYVEMMDYLVSTLASAFASGANEGGGGR